MVDHEWPGGGTGRRASLRSSCPWRRGSSTLPPATFLFVSDGRRRMVSPRRAGAPLALMRPVSRFDSGAWDLRAGRRSAEFHTLGGWVRLPCPQLSLSNEREWPGRQIGKAASMRCWCLWVRIPSRPLDSCLVLVRDDINVPWSNGRAPGLHPGDGGSIPSGMTVGVGSEMGCWSNGKTPGLQPGDRGSTPRRSTLSLSLSLGVSKRKAAGYGWPGLTAKECAQRA